jgi:hypothetical protein
VQILLHTKHVEINLYLFIKENIIFHASRSKYGFKHSISKSFSKNASLKSLILFIMRSAVKTRLKVKCSSNFSLSSINSCRIDFVAFFVKAGKRLFSGKVLWSKLIKHRLNLRIEFKRFIFFVKLQNILKGHKYSLEIFLLKKKT